MGTDTEPAESLSAKELQIIRGIARPDGGAGRPDIEELELRAFAVRVKKSQALEDLGVFDQIVDQIHGDQERPTGADQRFRGTFGDLFRLLKQGKDLDQEELITLLGSSAGGMLAPYVVPILGVIGWYLVEEFAGYTYTVYQKDEEGNYFKDDHGHKIPERDAEGKPITKTVKPPQLLHLLGNIFGLTAAVLEILVHALGALIEKDPVSFLKKYQPGIDLSLLSGVRG